MSIFICGMPRSGSTLLAHSLHSLNRIGLAQEYFGFDRLLSANALPVDHLARIAADDPGREFAASIFWTHLPFLLHYAGPNLEAYTDPKFVWLMRDDKIAQAVSWYKAEQTGQWNSRMGQRNEPVYDRGQITHYHKRLVNADINWANWFQVMDINPYRIRYEDLNDGLGNTVRPLIEWLSYDAESFRAPWVEKQADSINTEWVLRYRYEQSEANRGQSLVGQ